ncbi:hypothetical protein WYY_01442 [Bacillus velezensis M27]|nr:hypothetical protein KSO_001035 [Bacillus amyloliquefaciens IT-45]AHC44161.1 hypothetical protein U722_19225 [Bacillus amyloliquefaciens LFB112]EKE48655.1 hypothetical protein WYY_01442 [Bacillus velezensis M27]ERK85102.1 hypothetical protein N786_01100 [Bacillus amyloliquefaciens UASWS BA1]
MVHKKTPFLCFTKKGGGRFHIGRVHKKRLPILRQLSFL